MALMNQKVIRHHIKVHPAQVHLEQTRRLVPAVPGEPLVAPRDALARDHIRFVCALVGGDFVEGAGAGGEGKVVGVVGAVVAGRPGGVEDGDLGWFCGG